MAVTELGPMFIKAVNCEGNVKDKFFMANLINEVIIEVGPQNVVQVITDNAPVCKAAAHSINPRYYSETWLSGTSGRQPPHLDIKLSEERNKCIKRYFQDGEAIKAVNLELARFSGLMDIFGGADSIEDRGTEDPKRLGWKYWKKRWFLLTRTSLVFFKSDPSALPQRSGEVNLTLGGIDLNNSGSVVVREDKKLLTVLFPDGRAFTLKAETTDDLYVWKTALEHALAQAPSAALVMGHNVIFRSDTNDTVEGSFSSMSFVTRFSYDSGREKCLVKSLVVGCPILLALEDIDGGPSFLEKALRFLEKYGTKVEGILRQSADVEEVEQRVQEYVQGKNEFDPGEDRHVIGDCVKHVLRELPSSPVPASCCTALLEAYKIDRKEARVNTIHSATQEAFPEPNRRLLQRILKMTHTISSHASANRMTSSAVAACMAPLLLRPLVSGECELEDDYDTKGDNSAQLLAAANAANNAQAITTTLLEEFENIFDAIRNDDSYDGSPMHALTLVTINPELDYRPHSASSSVNDQDQQKKTRENMPNASAEVLGKEALQSVGEILSSMDQELHHSFPGPELLPHAPMPKLTNSNPSAKKSTFWRRRSASKTPSTESIDYSEEEEFAIQKLEIAKNDLLHRIAKEVTIGFRWTVYALYFPK
ncbi:hypothetical protein OROGR_024326 [Orobanche gracilis]